MAWDEWEQLKAEAADAQPARMSLNGAPSGARGSGGDVVVRDDELGKLGKMAFNLRERLRRDSDHARASTFDAATELFNGGLDMGAALTELHDAWNSQARTLVDACGHLSNNLDFSRASQSKNDAKVATSISASRINEYFK